MPQPLLDFYTSITTHNWFAVAALAIMIATQVLNTLPWLRARIWVKIPLGYRFLVPVLAAMAAAFVHGYFAHETLGTDLWDVAKIAFTAMGGAAALKESPLPWGNTGPGGVPLVPARSASVTPITPLPVIPPLALADATDDDPDKTPVDGHPAPPPSDPPPTPPAAA